MEPSEPSPDPSKDETKEFFKKMFEDQFNCCCYECGRKTRQWVERTLGIFLCLTCATLYKEVSANVKLKSITLQPWSSEELKSLQFGGNRLYREFICDYDMQHMIYKERLCTKAAQYYRIRMNQLALGREAPIPPDPIQGIEPAFTMLEMTPEQIYNEAMQKAGNLMGKTLEVGSKAYDTVSEKVKSGQLKEDIMNTAAIVGNAAKGAWSSLMSKLS